MVSRASSHSREAILDFWIRHLRLDLFQSGNHAGRLADRHPHLLQRLVGSSHAGVDARFDRSDLGLPMVTGIQSAAMDGNRLVQSGRIGVHADLAVLFQFIRWGIYLFSILTAHDH